MRLHITLDRELIERLDGRIGPRRRSSYIAEAVRRALDDDHRWSLLESAIGSLPEGGHAWDDDPAGWVRDQRRTDARRVG